MKIKVYIIAVILLSSIFSYSQDKTKNQGIELPAFVITGIQSVSVPVMSKKKSEFVPVIGKNFLIPDYNTDGFSLLDNSAPIKREMPIGTVAETTYNGLLQLGAGLETMPIGNLYFGLNNSDVFFTSHIFGSDTRDYLVNSGYNTSGAKVKLNYFLNHTKKYFKGLSLGVEGDFVRNRYFYFGTSTPQQLRENNFFTGRAFVLSQLDSKLQYGFDLGANILNMKMDGLFENVTFGNGFAEYKLSAATVGASGSYQAQKINDNALGYARADYFTAEGHLIFSNSKRFDLKLGLNYSQLATDNLLSPFVNLSVFVDKGVTLLIAYEGKGDFITLNDLMKENRYFEYGVSNIFQKTYSNIKVAIKYDFSDIFEVTAGFTSAEYDNFHYFEDVNNDNRFSVNLLDSVKSTTGFLNLIINAKRYGELFANIKFQNIVDIAGNKMPYNPMLMGDVSYGYKFYFGLYTKVKLNFAKFTYTNLSNSQAIPSYLNLGILLKYSLFNNFVLTCEVQNLLNKEYYLFKGYQEKPFDVIAGIEYRW